jgi:hypothetical protein
MPIYEATIDALRGVHRRISELRKEHAKALQLLAMMQQAREERTEQLKTATGLGHSIEEVLNDYRLDTLRNRAVDQLYMRGQIEKVMPLDDADALEQANPVRENGEVILDSETIEARQDAQARNLLKDGPLAVVVLGYAHHLADNVARLAGEKCEYVVVTTESVARFAGQ